MFAFIEASIAAAFGPMASGGNSVEAEGVPSTIPGIPSNPDPNSTAPNVVYEVTMEDRTQVTVTNPSAWALT